MTADQATLDLILRNARSYGEFEDRPVPEELLRVFRLDPVEHVVRTLPGAAGPRHGGRGPAQAGGRNHAGTVAPRAPGPCHC